MTAAGRVLVAVVLVGVTLTAPGSLARPPTRDAVPTTRVALMPAGAQPITPPFAPSHLGVRWHGDEGGSVEVRARDADHWGPWRRMSVAHDLDDDERQLHYSGLLRVTGAEQVQARAGKGIGQMDLVLIDAGSGPSTVRVAGPGEGPPQPEVITRAGWGADETQRRGPPQFAQVVKLIVHHTVTPNDDPDPASTVRAIYAYHTQARGWDDIGYNFLVDSSGRIYEGRWARAYHPGEIPTGEDESARAVVGAHAKGVNPGSVGVALLGGFSDDRGPTPEALDGLVRLLAWESGRHGIDVEGRSPYTRGDGTTQTFPNLAGHRDVGQTSCPGDRFYEQLPEIRQRVARAAYRHPDPPAAEPSPAPEPRPAPEPEPAPEPRPEPGPQPGPRPVPEPGPPLPALPVPAP